MQVKDEKVAINLYVSNVHDQDLNYPTEAELNINIERQNQKVNDPKEKEHVHRRVQRNFKC